MRKIDLHGIRHANVEAIIIDACTGSIPFIVVTGHSIEMKRLVADAAKIMGLITRDAIDNPGRVIIDENRRSGMLE